MNDYPRQITVAELKPGDMLDLEGDEYADPARDSRFFDCEYGLVGAVVVETPTCTLVYIDGVDAFGMPPDHVVQLTGHDTDYEPE